MALCIAATAGSAAAQTLFVRADAGVAVASESPYDDGGAAGNIAIGTYLDPAKQHELSLSVGVLAWAEPHVKGYRPDDGRGTTTVRIDGDYFDIPTANEHFTIDGDKLRLDSGGYVNADYRPSLGIVPVMANYRFNIGNADSRVRLFLGAGVGYARMRMESELWKEFRRNSSARNQSDTASSFTWSATAGFTVRLGRRVNLDFSYAFQDLEGKTFRMRNITCKLDRMQTHVVRGGATWLF